MEESNIKWTKSFVEEFNRKAESIGFPTLLISNGYVYKDELHMILGIGIKLEKEP